MKKLIIIILLAISGSASAFTLFVNSSVTNLNSAPIANHWVYIFAYDSINQYNYIDSTVTDTSGGYSFNVNNVPATQTLFDIYTYDCVNAIHHKYVFTTSSNPTAFQICTTAPTCNSQFTAIQDTINPSTYHFFNQSTNNQYNKWYVNNTQISTQANFSYTFPTNPSLNTVCLEITNAQQTCSDTSCTSIIIHNCSTSFTDSINGDTVIFTVSNSPQADFYYWDFGDGFSQPASLPYITHIYSGNGTYNVQLTTYSIYNQANDTCFAYYNQSITIAPQSNTGSIYGYAFADTSYLDYGMIMLYDKNPISQKMTLIDSSALIMDTSQTYTYYIFNGLPYGNYYLKSKISPSSVYYNSYYDTWASINPNSHVLQWQNAEKQTLSSGLLQTLISLKSPDVTFSNGGGRISGKIINTVGINTNSTIVYLLNQNKLLVKGIVPDAFGVFSFDSLIYGTYYLRPELTNINSLDYEVLISSNMPYSDSIQIHVDTNHFYVGKEEAKQLITKFNIYPNPASSIINIDIDSKTQQIVLISIYDAIGNRIYAQEHQINNNTSIKVPLSELISGLYIITISDSYSTSTKKFIKY